MAPKKKLEVAYTDSGSILNANASSESFSFYGAAAKSLSVESFQTTKDKIVEYFCLGFHLLFVLVLFYVFMFFLVLLGMACQLMATHIATAIFHSPDVIQNAVIGAACGCLITALIHSSEEALSLVVSLMSSNSAIPIIMGINIGHTFVGLMIAFAQIKEKRIFHRTFLTAALNCSLNCWSVLFFLPIEKLINFHYYVVNGIEGAFPKENITGNYTFKGILHGVTKFVIMIDHQKWQATVASTSPTLITDSIVKRWCPEVNATCDFIFDLDLPDFTLGLIIAAMVSPLTLIIARMITNTTSAILRFNTTKLIRNKLASNKITSSSFGGLLCMLVGVFLALTVVQQCCVTSIASILVGSRFISIYVAYPFMLGANLAISLSHTFRALTVLAHEKGRISVALCDLLFNTLGSMVFYLIPWIRLPFFTVEYLEDSVSRYRWLPFTFVFLWYFIIPFIIISLAYLSTLVLIFILLPVIIFLIMLFVTCQMQISCPEFLPRYLKTWDFLPHWLRSLDPLNSLYEKTFFSPCLNALKAMDYESESDIFQNRESRPGESISVVLERMHKQKNVFHGTPRLSEAAGVAGTQYPYRVPMDKTLPRPIRKETVDRPILKTASSSSEGSFVNKFTPYQSEYHSSRGSFETMHKPSPISTISSIRAVTPYSTSKFQVPKSDRRWSLALSSTPATSENKDSDKATIPGTSGSGSQTKDSDKR